MASKMQNSNLFKEKDARRNTKLYQDELPDEIALRDEILQLKKQMIMLRKANERNLVKVRKYEDEAKRKDRQIEQLMDPIKNGDVRKLLSTKGAVLLMNLKEQNNTLVQIILDKDVQIRRLLAEIKTSKLYAKRIRPESYKSEIDQLRNLVIKSQNVLKEVQDVSRGKPICAGEFPTLEMHLSSDQSSPRDLEDLQETIRSLEKYMKYSNDLIAKKNEQIMQLMDHLNAAMSINRCDICKENVVPRYKLDFDISLRNFFQKNSQNYNKEGIFLNDEIDMGDITRSKLSHSCGQTRFYSTSTEHLDTIFSFNKKKKERLTNSATERKFKNPQYKNYDDISNLKQSLDRTYHTGEYSLKDNVSKNEELEIQRTVFDVLNIIENVNKDESQTSNTVDNIGNRENNWSDIQKIKISNFDEFDNNKEVENGKKLDPITISVFSSQDIISTRKTPKSSENARSIVGNTLDDSDMETDEFEAIENKIENETELESLLKIQVDENRLKWAENNAESQIIKLNECVTETKKTEKSIENNTDKYIKTTQHSEHFEMIKNHCFLEKNNVKRFDKQYYDEPKAKEKNHSQYLIDDHTLKANEQLPNSDISNERSQSENETETLIPVIECFTDHNQENKNAFYENEKYQNGIKESFEETEKASVQLIPEKNESTNEMQKSFIYNQEMVHLQEIYPQSNNSSLDSEGYNSMEQKVNIKITAEITPFTITFNENINSEYLADNKHNGTNNKLISHETYRDEDDDDVVIVGLKC